MPHTAEGGKGVLESLDLLSQDERARAEDAGERGMKLVCEWGVLAAQVHEGHRLGASGSHLSAAYWLTGARTGPVTYGSQSGPELQEELRIDRQAAVTGVSQVERNRATAGRDGSVVWLATALAAGLTTYLGFAAGGFFPDATAIAVLALAAALVVRILTAPNPLRGLGRRSLPALGALSLLALWTLASAWWSHAPARATIEFDRVLLYLLALLLTASIASRRALLSGLVRGVAAGGVVLCVAGLATRTLPSVFPVAPSFATARLSYPVSYWNALGLLAAVCLILCVGLSSSAREPRAVRVISASVLPLLGVTVLLTFSRGAILAGTIGLVAMLALGRSRLLLGVLVAGIPATAVAVLVADGAVALARTKPTGPAAVSQGHDVAIVVAACCAAACLLRTLLLRWDGRPAGPPRKRLPRRVASGAALTAAVAVVLVAVAIGVPGQLAQQYHRFVTGSAPSSAGGQRTRLLDPSNNGRIELWRVGVQAWRSAPAYGHGAGTYQLLWEHDRHDPVQVINAHSLYVEVLAELGLVGFALLAVVLVSVLASLARLITRFDRAVAAAAFSAVLAWMVDAGVDWVWQMPAITLWLFAFGGAAVGRLHGERSLPALGSTTRLVVALAVLVVVVTPVRVGLSQLRLGQSVAAFTRGDCGRAIERALASNSALAARPEPFEILGYCDIQAGQTALAEHVIALAVQRDPADWQYHYDLALARAASGQDPRPEAARALALNPLQPEARAFLRATRTAGPHGWKRAASTAPLLIPH